MSGNSLRPLIPFPALLIEEDLKESPAAARRFISEDLAGMYEGPGITADNAAVRERLRNPRSERRRA